MENILVTGSNGQLGNELKDLFNNGFVEINKIAEISFTDVDSLDLTDQSNLKKYIQDNSFDFVINCAAYTDVGKAESEKELAFKINADCVNNIVSSIKKEAKFIHVSTDYVFDGNSYIPYTEEMPINPQSVYGESKEKGEKYALKFDQSIVIRTSWLYSSFGNNFAKTIHKLCKEKDELNVIFDQIGTPTYANDLAKAIFQIVEQSITKNYFVPGIYHYSNEGVCSWYDFAKAIVEKANSNCKVNPIESKDYPSPVKRPFYSVLNKHKIKSTYNIEIPHWIDGLNNFFKTLS